MFKRGFIDWDKEIWADPEPARKGDVMSEGMQLGTGQKSWAQLTWTYINARAWANSVYAIAPNQRLVYLTGGEMLYHLDKHRKDKGDYFVWTKLIQARIRGTTVLFQCSDDTTRVTVLEGCIDVMNRKDKSIIRIEPGVVYEVKDIELKKADSSHGSSASAASSSPAKAPAAVQVPPTQSGAVEQTSPPAASGHISLTSPAPAPQIVALTPIVLKQIEPVNIFKTAKTLTSLYLVNPELLLSHPLVSSLESPLSSLSLVRKSLTALLPRTGKLLNGGAGQARLLSKTLVAESKVMQVPKLASYAVGPAVGRAFKLPAVTTAFFPPSGVIGQPAGLSALQANQAGISQAGAYLPGTAAASTASILSTVSGASALNGFAAGSAVTAVPLPGVFGAAGTSMLPGTLGGIIPFQHPGMAGAGLSGLTGGLGAGLVGGVLQGAGGVAGGAVNGLTGQVNTLLNSTGNTLNSILGGGAGSLGLPLGHP